METGASCFWNRKQRGVALMEQGRHSSSGPSPEFLRHDPQLRAIERKRSVRQVGGWRNLLSKPTVRRDSVKRSSDRRRKPPLVRRMVVALSFFYWQVFCCFEEALRISTRQRRRAS